jgi:hypothetical protein
MTDARVAANSETAGATEREQIVIELELVSSIARICSALRVPPGDFASGLARALGARRADIAHTRPADERHPIA